MTNCITCDQPLPEGHKHPPFFAQAYLHWEDHDPGRAKEELGNVLDYALAVVRALVLAKDNLGDSAILGLHHLIGTLCEEAERRSEWLYEAAEYWQKQATSHTKEG